MKGVFKMEGKLPLDSSLDIAFEKLEKFLKTETVIGDPIVIGEVTLVPIITVAFGCGGGGGKGVDPKGGDGIGSGIGVGAKISPDAIMVIKNGDATILPIKQKQSMEKLINMVPELVEKFDLKKLKGFCDKEKEEENDEEKE